MDENIFILKTLIILFRRTGIAKFPVKERDHSKLLIYKHGEVSEDVFYNLPKNVGEFVDDI